MRKTTTAMVGSPAPSAGSYDGDARDTNSDSKEARNSAEKAHQGPRYSWNDDPERTHLLLDLVTDAFQRKPADRRYIRTSEWEVLFQAYNREASAPVESIKILHNRLAILRQQCKEYHEMLKAQRRGELETDDDWRVFAKGRNVVRKWQKTPFEFYEEMVECMRAQGEYLDPLDGPDDANHDANNGAAAAQQRRRQSDAAPATQSRNVKRKVGGQESVSTAGKTEQATATATVAVSSFPTALRHLKRLQLGLEERVDAKRFLVDEANAKAFVHMSEEEQLFFLDKYCFRTAPRPNHEDLEHHDHH